MKRTSMILNILISGLILAGCGADKTVRSRQRENLRLLKQSEKKRKRIRQKMNIMKSRMKS